MSNKQERHESISVESGGINHTGHLIISGTRKLRFTVEYRGRESADGRVYGTGAEELHNLRVMARLHLLRIISELEPQ